jgi:hypothetical protein
MARLHLLALFVVLIAASARPTAASSEFMVLAPKNAVAAQSAALTVLTPKNGDVLKNAAFSITFQTANIKIVPTTVPVAEAGKHPEANIVGEGHLHFVLDLQPLVVWEKTDPYTFNDVPPGEHRLMAELVNNDHSSLSPRVMQMIMFRVEGPSTLPTTAQAEAWPGTSGLFLAGLATLIILIGAVLILQGLQKTDH